MGATDGELLREFLGPRATPELVATWMRADDVAQVLVELLCEGPHGRTGTQIGLWVGHPVRYAAHLLAADPATASTKPSTHEPSTDDPSTDKQGADPCPTHRSAIRT